MAPEHESRETYDFAVIGNGIGGLAIASLLAHAGRRVILFDRHYLPGGYGQTFGAGRYLFCAELHYDWDCGPGQRVHRFLEHLGLAEQVRFRRLNPDGFDRIIAPGIDYTIGSGYDRECRRLAEVFPGQEANLRNYYGILTAIYHQAYQLPLGYSWKTLLRHPVRYWALIRYLGWTLQDLFDLLQFPPPLQLILAGQSAIFFLPPPKQLSLIVHAAGVTSYDTGAYVPEQSFRHLIKSLVEVVRRQPGCRVALATEVTQVHVDEGRATAVTTSKGQTIAVNNVIYDGDPQRSLDLIGPEKLPPRFRQRLSYPYSISALSIYLGLKDINLREFGFGDENLFWHPSVDLRRYGQRHAWPSPQHSLCDSALRASYAGSVLFVGDGAGMNPTDDGSGSSQQNWFAAQRHPSHRERAGG